MRTELEAFRPARWAAGPHAQTLFARALRSPDGPPFTRRSHTTPDDDFLVVDYGPEPAPDAPIVLILHGLEGSSRRRYVRNVARELLARGIQPIAMNFRGCSGEMNRALRFYHSGETTDASWMLERLRDRHPHRRLGAMGFSLGGNVLLKLLGEREDGGAGLVDAAAAMSVPYDLGAGCRLLGQSAMGSVYSNYFLRSLKKKVAAKADRLRSHVDVSAALASESIWEFDEIVTAPLNGFEDAADYYARCSSGAFLPAIRVPTLLTHAIDDPFLPADAIPAAAADDNPSIRMELTERGGHVGFLAGPPWRPTFWADEATADHLAAALR